MRFKVIRVFYLLAFVLIILRLGYWQIVRSDDLTARAENQRIVTKDVLGQRGQVLYSDRSILATNAPSYLVFIQPQFIKNDHKFTGEQANNYFRTSVEKIAKLYFEYENKDVVLTPDEKDAQIKALSESLYKRIKPNLYWISLGIKVNYELKKQLEQLEIIGLGFDQNSKRFYPEASLSAHLLGFLASDDYGNEKGYFGLEGFYDGELRGKKGVLTQEKDALGLPILIGKFLEKQPKDGKTLVLNIDRSIQYILEQKLKKGIEKYKSKGASAIIMEPKSGKILAMASLPNYDPGSVTKFPKEYFKNPITADGYEPGSTFKVLVMAAGINEGLVKPDTKCDICSGPISLSGYTIRTWNNEYRENASMTDVIVHSDNTGMVFVGQKLGIEKMYAYIKKFGFGDLTGVDLQDESSPDIRDEKEWKEIDLATSSFGQGISVTALQVVRAVSAIANGGNVMEPQVVKEIIDGEITHKISPRVVEEVITEDTAKQIKEMMVKAVDEGEAKFAKKVNGLLGYKIAGKTGTAQIPVAGHYDATKTIASFVGFAPADDPKFVMLVRYDQPTSSIYGSETAAPTFFEIAKELFTYFRISPTENTEIKK